MKFHWTEELFGYALRDSNARCRSIIIRGEDGFYGQIFMAGLPDSGPYKARRDAAEWLTRMCVQLGHLPADSEFSELPIPPKAKRAA